MIFGLLVLIVSLLGAGYMWLLWRLNIKALEWFDKVNNDSVVYEKPPIGVRILRWISIFEWRHRLRDHKK